MVLIGHSFSDGEGRLLAVDSHVCEILHREERELIGVLFQSITHPEDRERNVAAVMALRPADRPLSLKKRYLRPDGSAVWSSIQVSRMRSDDGSRLVGTIQLIHPDCIKPHPERLWRSAKNLSASIDRRRAELSDDLFTDYPWTIMLQIYIAEAEGRMTSAIEITNLGRLRIAVTTRWLLVLEQRGLIEFADSSKFHAQLTALGIVKVERLLDTDATI